MTDRLNTTQTSGFSRIRRENLALTLEYAIEARAAFERDTLGYTTDSVLVTGWKEVLEGIRDNKPIYIYE